MIEAHVQDTPSEEDSSESIADKEPDETTPTGASNSENAPTRRESKRGHSSPDDGAAQQVAAEQAGADTSVPLSVSSKNSVYLGYGGSLLPDPEGEFRKKPPQPSPSPNASGNERSRRRQDLVSQTPVPRWPAAFRQSSGDEQQAEAPPGDMSTGPARIARGDSVPFASNVPEPPREIAGAAEGAATALAQVDRMPRSKQAIRWSAVVAVGLVVGIAGLIVTARCLVFGKE